MKQDRKQLFDRIKSSSNYNTSNFMISSTISGLNNININ